MKYYNCTWYNLNDSVNYIWQDNFISHRKKIYDKVGEILDKNKLLKYWIETANRDYDTMLHLYKDKDYHWCLFMGHLVIEKLLKALYTKNIDNNVPRIHDLSRLADKALVEITEEQQDILDELTTFNISVRYPDYEQNFYKKCDYEFTTAKIKKIKELRKWLLSLIGKIE